MQVGGLPGPAGQGGCKVGRMLASAAGDLQRSAGGGQQREQLGQDGPLVALCGGAVLKRRGGHEDMECFGPLALVDHALAAMK